jgi:protein-S-isoprenylcysteine O-methyltransferase Ste14
MSPYPDCGGPLRRSHSPKEGPYAEERSWKRQLVTAIVSKTPQLDHLLCLPLPIPRTDLHRITAGFMILIGIAVFVAGIRNFSSAATPVQGTEPARTLVTTGIHGRSRNPIYIGMFLVYAGIGIAVRSPWILILALPLAITMRYGIVAREEAYLERRFGDTYRDYKARVRRWL